MFAITSSSMPLTRLAFGYSLIRHVTSIPSKQSTAGDRYTLPAGIANSLIPDKRSSSGFSLWKSLCTSFGTAGLISPYTNCISWLLAFTSRRSSFITLQTTFSETFIPVFFSSAWVLRYPYRACFQGIYEQLHGVDYCYFLPVLQVLPVDAVVFFNMLIVSFKISAPIEARTSVFWVIWLLLNISFHSYPVIFPAWYFSCSSEKLHLLEDIAFAIYMLTRLYPISSDADFTLSPFSKRRRSTCNLNSAEGFLGCSVTLF